MIELHLTRGDNYEGVYLRLPATPAEVGEAYAMLDSISRYAGETHIVDVKSPVKNLAQFIKNADLAKQEELDKLNRLAEKIGSMTVLERTLFSGALWTESINSLDDVLRVADRLEDYEIIPEVTCDWELGGYVVEHGLVMDFPEAVRPYLDYVGIGAEYYADHGGAYTMDGYVKRRDGQPEQTPEHTVFSTCLRSHCGAKRLRFYFPAAEEALENAKQRLQIDSFAEAEVEALDCDIPYLVDLLPASCISVEDINELALACVCQGKSKAKGLEKGERPQHLQSINDRGYYLVSGAPTHKFWGSFPCQKTVASTGPNAQHLEFFLCANRTEKALGIVQNSYIYVVERGRSLS